MKWYEGLFLLSLFSEDEDPVDSFGETIIDLVYLSLAIVALDSEWYFQVLWLLGFPAIFPNLSLFIFSICYGIFFCSQEVYKFIKKLKINIFN